LADFTSLNAKVAALPDLIQSAVAMRDGLMAQIAALTAERDALAAADAIDQEAISALDAQISQATTALETLRAVTANTPADAPV